MSSPRPRSPAPELLPRTPSAAQWRALSPKARAQFIDAVNTALGAPRETMAEGRPHARARDDALDALRLFFSRTGRRIYLAAELSVLYPDEEPFAPDILAVLDVEEGPTDERMAWVVADEGKGVDLALEVIHSGNREKDLVRNVERYARLGVPEYIIYDRLQQQLYVYRLPSPQAGRYQRVHPRLGRHTSQVLGLDMALFEGRVRFFNGPAELPLSPELIGKLERMMGDLEARYEAAQAQAEAAQAQAEAARAAERRARIEAILGVLQVRGIAVSTEARAQIEASEDPALLAAWFARSLTAASVEELLGPA